MNGSAADQVSSPLAERERVPPSAWFGLVVMIAVSIYSVIDRQIFILFAEAIRKDMGLNDTQLGLLQGVGLSLVGLVTIYPISWLADRYDRRRVIAVCVLVWSVAVAGCGLAPGFVPLFVFASLVGVGEAGAGPAALAMIPDLFPVSARQLANSIFVIATRLSQSIGVWLAGMLIVLVDWTRPMLPAAVASIPEWRLCFLAAILFAPVAIVLPLTLPRRTAGLRLGNRDRELDPSEPPPNFWRYVAAHPRPFTGVVGATLCNQFGLVAIAGWLPIIAQRYYGQTPKQGGEWLAALALLTAALGFAIGTPFLKWLASRKGGLNELSVLAWVMLFGAAASALIALAHDIPQLYLLWGVQAVGLMVGVMILPTMLQNMVPVALRARVFALYLFSQISAAAGYVVVGGLSDLLHDVERGLLYAAVAIAVVFLLFSALIFRLTAPSYARLVAQVRQEAAG